MIMPTVEKNKKWPNLLSYKKEKSVVLLKESNMLRTYCSSLYNYNKFMWKKAEDKDEKENWNKLTDVSEDILNESVKLKTIENWYFSNTFLNLLAYLIDFLNMAPKDVFNEQPVYRIYGELYRILVKIGKDTSIENLKDCIKDYKSVGYRMGSVLNRGLMDTFFKRVFNQLFDTISVFLKLWESEKNTKLETMQK